MQVIIFDQDFKCIYHIYKVPDDWNFKQIAIKLQLKEPYSKYKAFRLANFEQLHIDNYIYDNGELLLTKNICN